MPNKYFLILSLLLFFSCKRPEQSRKDDVQSAIITQGFKTIDVDSLFQISFPKSFSRTKTLSEEAIVQYNDLCKEEHFILIKSEKTNLSMLEELRQIQSFSKISNQKEEMDIVSNDTIESLICGVYSSNSKDQYSYWLTRYKTTSSNYLLCRWTTKKNENDFRDDAKLIGDAFLRLEH